MKETEKLEFLMSQLQQAADIRVRMETQRVPGGGTWEFKPWKELQKAYVKSLEEVSNGAN